MNIKSKFYLGSLLAGMLWLPGALWAACNTDSETEAISVYSLSGQGNFSCDDLNLPSDSSTTGVIPTFSGKALNWLIGTAEEVDAVVVEDSSGKRCLYNYGPGAMGGTGLTPPANKPIASYYFCADGDVKPTPNTAPGVEITSPSDSTEIAGGEEVRFEGTALDSEDGGLTALLEWNSSLNGFLGNGSGFTISDLSTGLHTITAQVADSEGLIGTDSILLTVMAVETQACEIIEEGGVVTSVLINGVKVICPEVVPDDDQPRLVCSADLATDADKFELGSAACCLCNATATQCDPDLAEGDEPDVGGLEPCPVSDAINKGALQVPTTLMFNNDPYYCYTIGGRRTCFAY